MAQQIVYLIQHRNSQRYLRLESGLVSDPSLTLDPKDALVFSTPNRANNFLRGESLPCNASEFVVMRAIAITTSKVFLL